MAQRLMVLAMLLSVPVGCPGARVDVQESSPLVDARKRQSSALSSNQLSQSAQQELRMRGLEAAWTTQPLEAIRTFKKQVLEQDSVAGWTALAGLARLSLDGHRLDFFGRSQYDHLPETLVLKATQRAAEFVQVAASGGVREVITRRDGPWGDYSQAPPEDQPRRRSELG